MRLTAERKLGESEEARRLRGDRDRSRAIFRVLRSSGDLELLSGVNGFRRRLGMGEWFGARLLGLRESWRLLGDGERYRILLEA